MWQKFGNIISIINNKTGFWYSRSHNLEFSLFCTHTIFLQPIWNERNKMSITGNSCFVMIDRNEIYFCFMNKDGAIDNAHELYIFVLSQSFLRQITTKEDWSFKIQLIQIDFDKFLKYAL